MGKGLIDFPGDKFLTLPGEQLIVAKREHWIVLPSPILLVGLIVSLLIAGIIALYTFRIIEAMDFLVLFLILMTIGFSALSNILISWCFHIHLVTNRKILEIRSAPLVSDKIDNVFLDQVRTTEVDVKMHNFLMELLDVGDIILAFDRPSHEEVFTLKNIKFPRRIGLKLADTLQTLMEQGPSVWFKSRTDSDHIRVAEDVEDHPIIHVTESVSHVEGA